jgi:hypothetical protein
MYALLEAGERDLDLADMAVLPDDWATVCRIASEVIAMPQSEVGGANRHVTQFAELFANAMTNQDLAQFFVAVVGADAETRGLMMRMFGEREGLPSCPAPADVWLI